VKPENKTPAKTQTEPHARPLPDSEVRPLRKPPDEKQGRSGRELEADPVIEFVIRTVVRNVAETVRRNLENNVQNAVSKTVADYVSRNPPGFHYKALVRTIDPGVGNNVAESDDEFEAEFDDGFVAEIIDWSFVRQVADSVGRAGAVALTFIRPSVSFGRETTAAALHRDLGLRFLLRRRTAQRAQA
jgi:hypothetical protein